MILFPKSAARNPRTKPGDLDALARSASNPEVLELVARNTSTPLGALEKLASSSSPRVRGAVAGNPAAGADLLETLSRDSDASVRYAVAANEAASPQTLTDLVRSDSAEVRRAVAGNRATPLSARVQLSKRPELWEIVIKTGSLESPAARAAIAARAWGNREERRLLAYDTDEDVRRALASSLHVEHAVLDILVDDPAPRVASVAAAARSTDERTLTRLAGADDILVLSNLSRNPATPALVKSELARRLAHVADDGTLVVIARDGATPPEVLVQLASHRNPSVRNCVARNSRTPPDAIEILAADADITVRTSAAASRKLSLEAVIRLAGDSEKSVRQEVARNHCTPPALLTRLAGDEDEGVRAGVAGNTSSPVAAFLRIMATLNTMQSELASSTKDWMSQREEQDRARRLGALMSMHRMVAQNPSAPSDVLADIAAVQLGPSLTHRVPPRGIDYWVNRDDIERERLLRIISSNPSTSIKTLRLLSGAGWVADRTESEWHHAPRDEGGPYSVTVYSARLTKEARDQVAFDIRRTISHIEWQEGANVEVRLRLAHDDATAPEILAELAKETSIAVRRAVAANGAAPIEALRLLAVDSSPDIRSAVAASGRTPSDVFLQLVGDPSIEVRLAAANSTHVQGCSSAYRPDSHNCLRDDYRHAFELLAQDKVARIRAAAVANCAFWSLSTPEFRGRMAFDPDRTVRTTLVQSYLRNDDAEMPIAALMNLVDTGDLETWRALARSYKTPGKIQARLAAVGDRETRLDLARTSAEETLAMLASTDDSAVLLAVAQRNIMRIPRVTIALARNRHAPSQLLAELAQQADDETLRSVVLNPAAPTEPLLKLARGTDPQRLRAILLSTDPRVHVLVAANPEASADVLQHLADSEDPEVREQLLLNPNTPPAVLARLIEAS